MVNIEILLEFIRKYYVKEFVWKSRLEYAKYFYSNSYIELNHIKKFLNNKGARTYRTNIFRART